MTARGLPLTAAQARLESLNNLAFSKRAERDLTESRRALVGAPLPDLGTLAMRRSRGIRGALMSDVTPALAAGTLVAGKLRVVRALGIGGMGTVYEVEHELTRHRRALKLLHAELSSNHQAVARFLREASAAGRIGNPHIVETFDAGTLETGEPYLVMEMLDGRSLADLLEETGRLSERDAVNVVAQACDGLQAAHDAGIIHRDIKPDNLFMERSGRLKILDFGISKFDEALTGEKQLTGDLTLGTPYYMAPEQTSKTASVDQRADVYALGVVLYECVTGRKPFEAETYPQLVVRIHLGDYEPASSVCGISALIDGIIAKAMARKPELRFQAPAELAAALRDAVLATERAPSPVASTQRAGNLESLLERQRQPAAFAPMALHPSPPPPRDELPATRWEGPGSVPPRSPSAGVSAGDATLLSAGSDAPAPRSSSSRWLVPAVALGLLGGFAAWWTSWKATVVPPPQGVAGSVSASAAAAAPGPAFASPASALAETKAAPAPRSSSPAPVDSPAVVPTPSTSPSNKLGNRAKQHALEEENPFR